MHIGSINHSQCDLVGSQSLLSTDRAAAIASLVEKARIFPKSCAVCGCPDLRTPEHGQFSVCKNCRTTHMHRTVAS